MRQALEHSDIVTAPGPGIAQRITCSPEAARHLFAAASDIALCVRLGTGDASAVRAVPLCLADAHALLNELWVPQLELIRFGNSISIQTM